MDVILIKKNTVNEIGFGVGSRCLTLLFTDEQILIYFMFTSDPEEMKENVLATLNSL